MQPRSLVNPLLLFLAQWAFVLRDQLNIHKSVCFLWQSFFEELRGRGIDDHSSQAFCMHFTPSLFYKKTYLLSWRGSDRVVFVQPTVRERSLPPTHSSLFLPFVFCTAGLLLSITIHLDIPEPGKSSTLFIKEEPLPPFNHNQPLSTTTATTTTPQWQNEKGKSAS